MISAINVYPVGTYVSFVNGSKKEKEMYDESLPVGMILEVIIKESGVLYSISWWNDGIRIIDLFTELEFSPVSNVEKIKIGFKS